MKLKGDYTFDAPQQLVWDALNDPNVLGSVMPGSQGFTEVGDNEYEGALKVRVGPVQGNFEAKITLTEVNAPDSYTLTVDGKGAAGNVNASGGMSLKPEGDNQTHMEYEGTAQITGRIASVGQRLMDSTAKSIVRQSLNSLNEYLKIQVAQQEEVAPPADETPEPADAEEIDSAGEETNITSESTTSATTTKSSAATTTTAAPMPEFKPPSQMEVGMNVARDVLDDFVPKEFQPLLLVGFLAIIALILWRVF